MRCSIAVAAFAAGALAVPFAENEKRDVAIAYAYQTDYVTDVATVTVYGDAPATTKAAHYGHKPVYSTAWTSVETVTNSPAPAYSAPASPSESSEAPAATGGTSDYQQAVIASHNLHRANHSAPALVWDDDLYSCAQTIAESCVYAHNTQADGGGYGQNIAAGVAGDNITAVITDMFYNGEEPLYAAATMDYTQSPDMSSFEDWGHFTQIVWEQTTSVACYTADCSAQGLANTGSGVSPYFTVCNYKSPGNYAGEYTANVKLPKGDPTASWTEGAY